MKRFLSILLISVSAVGVAVSAYGDGVSNLSQPFPHDISINDDSTSGSSPSVTYDERLSRLLRVDCGDPDGCNLDFGESNPHPGDTVWIRATGSNNVTIDDQSGVITVDGGSITLNPSSNDGVIVQYLGDIWREMARPGSASSHDTLTGVSDHDHLSDSEIHGSINADSDHSSTASHDHDDLSGVTNSDHHTKTTSLDHDTDLTGVSSSDHHTQTTSLDHDTEITGVSSSDHHEPPDAQEGGTTVVSDLTLLDWLSGDFDITNPTTGEAGIALASDVTQLGSAIDHDTETTGVSSDDHHAQNHSSRHQSTGGDSLSLQHGEEVDTPSSSHHSKTTSLDHDTDITGVSSSDHHTQTTDTRVDAYEGGTLLQSDITGIDVVDSDFNFTDADSDGDQDLDLASGAVDTGELAFDTATQTELDSHSGTSDAHHTKTTDTRVDIQEDGGTITSDINRINLTTNMNHSVSSGVAEVWSDSGSGASSSGSDGDVQMADGSGGFKSDADFTYGVSGTDELNIPNLLMETSIEMKTQGSAPSVATDNVVIWWNASSEELRATHDGTTKVIVNFP